MTTETSTVNMNILSQIDHTERRYRIAASAAFVVVMLVIGVPLWWNTTKVYRATLPNPPDFDQSIRLPVLIRITSTTDIANAVDLLLIALQSVNIYDRIQFEFSADINRVNVSDSFHDEHHQFRPISRLALDFLVVPDHLWNYPGQLYFSATSVTKVRHVDGEDASKLAKLIESAILDVLIDVDQLTTIVRRDLKQRMSPDELATLPERIQKRRVWDSTVLAAAYNVYVVVVYPNVTTNTDHHLTDRLLNYLQPFVDRLENVTRLIVSRQNLYYVSLSAWQRHDAALDADVIDYDRLPLIVDSFDRYLSTIEEPNTPILRIIVYMPSQPMYILDEIGDRVASNAITVASWGGVTVVNRHESSDEIDQQEQLATTILSQLRTLLGLDDSHPPVASSFASVPITDWQVQRMALRSFVDNTLQTASTLRSLDKLLDEISNIVINDRVAERVQSASEQLAIATTTIGHDDFWSACDAAMRATAQADRAFFDESLLALLYFPEDQKYAIYIPLFLPVGYPVLMSVYALYKYFGRIENK